MRVHVNGVELEYVEAGAGIPVVFSHGGASDARYWEPQRAAFAARYRFVTYSRQFHGAGVWPPDADTAGQSDVEDLVEILRRLPDGPAHLVGFSTALALRAVLQAPGRVRSLVLIEPNAPWLLEGDPEGEAVLAWWRAENRRVKTEAAGDAGRAAALWFELVNHRGPGTFAAQPPALRAMWLANFGARPPAAPSPLTCAQLGAIARPALVIGAEHGMPYSRRIVDALAGCIPGSRCIILPGVTHFMSYQEPAVFNRAVLDFLVRCDGAPRAYD